MNWIARCAIDSTAFPAGMERRMAWTADDVSARLVEAMDVVSRLPAERPGGFKSSMPEYLRSLDELREQGAYPHVRPGAPQPNEIDRCIEALGWLQWVTRKESIILQALAVGGPWYRIEAKFRRRRRTIRRWEKCALGKIVDRLNGGGEKNC